MRIGVCLKWVDRRPEIDRVAGVVSIDDRFSGASHADQAALEWGLRCAEGWGASLTVATAGPIGAETLLRDALACGATDVVRVSVAPTAGSSHVAAELASAVAGSSIVWCGDHSLDRGSGSVPAFLAARLGAAQALGVVDVALESPGVLRVTRRLDGARRELLRVHGPTVISVEGSTAVLRRASLSVMLRSQRADIAVRVGGRDDDVELHGTARPFRPRARVFPAPVGATATERIVALTTRDNAPAADREAVTLTPAEAADRILAALADWGYDVPS